MSRWVEVAKWLFVYLPRRFVVPAVLLVGWYLFYVWPWVLSLVFPDDSIPPTDPRRALRDLIRDHVVPGWIGKANLLPAAKAAVVLTLLLAGVLLAYNLSALIYAVIRRWWRTPMVLLVAAVVFALYGYPWVFTPARWGHLPADPGTPLIFAVDGWATGLHQYGVLWLLPIGLAAGWGIAGAADAVRKPSPVDPGSGALPGATPLNTSFAQTLKDKPDLRIGVVLAGGGAKGVYQAGAMRAIHEFLAAHGALGNVKMVAGTSIGAWNSLFWLADKVTPKPGQPSPHEEWWRSASVARIARFRPYVPMFANAFMDVAPWREDFHRIFDDQALGPQLSASPSMHFYLTRSNVESGRLAFTTNWDVATRDRALKTEEIRPSDATPAQRRADLCDAVFASMDLPPLFPYQRIGADWFEDGGVIDNLPIRFATFVERCDLVFVLPLNASYEAEVSHGSILRRLMRVMDVRQGALERDALRMTYLYNAIESARGAKVDPAMAGTAKAGLVARVFAICPRPPLAVDTAQFWKASQFARAYRTMYQATQGELSTFDFSVLPSGTSKDKADWIRVALVSDAGNVTYAYDL